MQHLFPRRFAFGAACVALTALWMTIDYFLSRVSGIPYMLGGATPAIIFLGWLGVFLIVSALIVGLRKASRYGLLVDMNIRINRAILLEENIDSIYDTILDYVFKIFPHVTYGSVLALGDDGYLTFAAAKGYDDAYVRGFRLKLEESFIFQDSGGKIDGARLISDKTLYRLHVRFHPDNWDFRAVISAPLYVKGRLFGLLNLDSSKSNTFTPNDVHLVEQLTAQIEVCLLARGIFLERIEESREDALTGLMTRRYFEDLLAREIGRCERYGERFVFALFDADGLKAVNDTLGHRAGDRFLVAMADSLRRGYRVTDILGRFGGDEFVVLYHGDDPSALSRHLDLERDRLRSSPVDFEGNPIVASFSYGLALFPDEGKTMAELVDVADGRLYEMKKRNGSDRPNR